MTPEQRQNFYRLVHDYAIGNNYSPIDIVNLLAGTFIGIIAANCSSEKEFSRVCEQLKETFKKTVEDLKEEK